MKDKINNVKIKYINMYTWCFMNILKNKKIHNIFFIALWLVAVFATSYAFAAQRVVTCDYVSINGDFQSYNVFRRILDGQTPYADFANYIGMAPVFVNLPFVAVKNTFANSLFVTNFTSKVVFCVSVFIIIKAVTKHTGVACFVSALIPKFVETQILLRLLGSNWGSAVTADFHGMYTPSNSMRGVRSFLPFLMVIVLFLAKAVYQKVKGRQLIYAKELNTLPCIAAIGVLQGLFVVWSNDFGIACLAMFFVLYLFMQLFSYKDKIAVFLRNVALWILCAVCGMFVSAAVVTKGAPFALFDSIRQTAEYQFFYFNGSFKPVIKYIFANGRLWIYTGIFIAVLLIYLYRLIKKQITDADLAAVFIILSVAAGTFAYICSGSGYNFKEAIEVYSLLFVLAFVLKAALFAVKKYPIIPTVFAALGMAAISAYFALIAYNSTKLQPIGTYIEELGGTTTLTSALVDAKDFIGEEQIFSLYATGLETVTDQYQPTGYDYIIHNLGDEARKTYVDDFVKGDYKYVQTSSLDVAKWLANQNWYFYREFIGKYDRVFQTEYSHIWQKRDTAIIVDADADIEIQRISDKQVKLVITSANTDAFIADVLVDYKIEFTSLKERLLCLNRNCLTAYTNICFDGGGFFDIAYPSQSAEYIPVRMIDGKGEVVLTAQYGDDLSLEINSAEFVGALPPFYLN